MIRTKRLILDMATDVEMEQLILSEQDEEMKKAYTEMLEGCQKHPEQRVWYCVWFMKLQDKENTIIGDLCFKGLSADGMVDIGYGIKPEYEGNGYTTEAVKAMVCWANAQSGVKRIEAETDPDNIASQRVLFKAGFIANGEMGEEGPRFIWKETLF